MINNRIRIALLGMASAGALVALQPAAYAADVVRSQPEEPAPIAPAPAPLNTWSGPYAGVVLGYGVGTTDTAPASIDTNGVLGGAFVGYNLQSGPVIYGGEVDMGYNWMDGSSGGTTTKSGLDGSLRARLGYAVTDNVMIYGTAGGAATRMEVSDAAGSDSNTMYGWTAGVGADAMLTDQVFARAEYRYVDFGSKTFNTGSGAQSVDANQNRFMVGLGMKF
jgi:outer membrane immunogenic protein